MLRGLYSLLVLALQPLVFARLLWRGRRQPAYRRHLGERFGRYRSRADGPRLWLHAVSVGEMRAAQPLLRRLRDEFPETALLITCTTPTGRDTADALYGADAEIVYLPYDTPGAVERFLAHFRPRLGVLMETELWPNLIAAANRRGVPLLLANARLSARSARGYQRLSALTRPAFAALTAVLAQSDADAARLRACGATPVSVAGNLKFDVAPDPAAVALGERWRAAAGERPILLGASTRDGEEALILAAWERLATPDVLLVLVPRHPQRFDTVTDAVRARGQTPGRRQDSTPTPQMRVWLGDSMGEMAAYYALADLAIMGGSLKPFGSQNLIEACAGGCPVLCGPSDFNFAQATADALAVGAACRVTDEPAAIAATVDALLASPDRLAAMRHAARTFAREHQGATEITLQAVRDALGVPSTPP